MDDNKLIAEFMGLVFSYRSEVLECDFYYTPDEFKYLYDNDQIEICPTEMMYDQSWDWLMPVVEKIEGLGYSTIICKSSFNWTSIWEQDEVVEHWQKEISIFREKGKLENTYQSVVEFIKWYNKQ